MTRPYTKSATSWAKQVFLLQQRGMVIANPTEAEFYLQHLNYYRLSAYWLPFESDHDNHRFHSGTSFEAVLNLYIFDRQLRLHVLDAIERVEVSIRSAWTYHLAHHSGPHAHLDAQLAFNLKNWQKNLDKLTDEISRSDETFIKHYRQNYNETLPPIWASCEVMILGLLSRWYDNLKPMQVRQAIAKTYFVDESVLASWLRHLSLVRNTCAHHSRLWNREFTITPKAPGKKPWGLATQWAHGSRKLYNSLVILLHCMDIVAPGHHWRAGLKKLIQHHAITSSAMDFPANWQELAIWQVVAA